MQMPSSNPVHYHVGSVLQQRIATNAHEREHAQRQQCHNHDDHFGSCGKMHPHQFRVTDQHQQDAGLYRVARLQHTAQ